MLSYVGPVGNREPGKASEESKNSGIPAVGGQLRQLCAEEREGRDGRERAALRGPGVVQLGDGGGPSQTAGTGGKKRHRDNPGQTLFHCCVPCFFLLVKLHFF